MSERIQDFLSRRRRDGQDNGPCLVVDTDIVRDNYNAFAKALPDTRVFYAVKANPEPKVLKLLADLGSCFDTASVQEIQMVLDAGATPDRMSFGNTIKKERDIARAYALGIRLFAVDCETEVEKVARAAQAPKFSAVFCAMARAPNGHCRASLAACRKWRRKCWSMPIAWVCAPMAFPSMLVRSRATRLCGMLR